MFLPCVGDMLSSNGMGAAPEMATGEVNRLLLSLKSRYEAFARKPSDSTPCIPLLLFLSNNCGIFQRRLSVKYFFRILLFPLCFLYFTYKLIILCFFCLFFRPSQQTRQVADFSKKGSLTFSFYFFRLSLPANKEKLLYFAFLSVSLSLF
jgi:hypothetical protein